MADFAYRASRIEEAPEFNVLISDFENMAEQRREVWPNARRKWKLHFEKQTSAEWQAIRDFFLAKKGPLTAFTWVNPNDSVQYTVRFGSKDFPAGRLSGIHFDFDIEFIEVM